MRGSHLLAGLAAAVLVPAMAGAQAQWGIQRPAPLGGYYDTTGKWIGDGGYMDSNGRWHDASAAGHYDGDGRWVADSATGYYDRAGHWIATAPSAGESAADVAYTGADVWAGAPLETRAREDWLERRIGRQRADGRIAGPAADNALAELGSIRRLDRHYRSFTGELTPVEQARIERRLDALRRLLAVATR